MKKKKFIIGGAIGLVVILLLVIFDFKFVNLNPKKEPKYEVPTHEHLLSEPVYTWNDDHSSCTATITCTFESEGHQCEHKITETKESTLIESYNDATCTLDGMGKVKVTFENALFTEQILDNVIVEAKLGHNFVDGKCIVCETVFPTHTHSYTVEYMWDEDNIRCTAEGTCNFEFEGTKCSHHISETQKAAAITDVAATCKNSAYGHLYVEFENETFEAQTYGDKIVVGINLGHNFSHGKCERCGKKAMIGLGYIIMSVLSLGLVALILLNKYVFKKDEKRNLIINKVAKILCIVYMSLEFFTLFIPDALSYRYSNLELSTSPYGFLALIRWFNELAFVLLPLALWFKDKKVTYKLVSFFVLPVAILYAGLYYQALPSMMESVYACGLGKLHFLGDPNGLEMLLTNPLFRSFIFISMISIEIGLCVYILTEHKEELKFSDGKEILIFAVQLLLLLATVVPTYALQHVFHTRTELYMKPYKLNHLLWAVEIIIELIVVTMIAKKWDYETRKMLIYVLVFSLLLQYHQMFNMLGEINCKRIPLQLCNIASYLSLFALITMNKKIYHFSLVGNVVGAIFAIILLNNDSGDGLLQPMNLHYIMEHQNVICAPILMLTLDIFPPLEKKDFKDIIKVWTVYFLIVLTLGTIFYYFRDNVATTEADKGWWYCNYFFMFDEVQAGQFVGFSVPLFLLQLSNGAINFKLIQPVLYGLFFGLFAATFFIMYAFNKRRHNKLKLNK